ncbi:hypothetical protein FCR2A7T_23780 [Flavobacterium cauense R2A-7]|uniref:Uncharacterized membrane protein YoaK (UPF0700 family) n=1 Tax=Flavobacterium cauense R2A-7 TaxID=1341154 RepID=V6RWW0_9FLAO|nr:YoaK family protein [Flavobacterium cauense]ESU18971.1 hypothetical protein FCR2A7T_23780 [Flavobacterium cauense R2A-7]TWI15371.1 uncharacterized membrane protein YoaK (UPF0700 family) [Flavobacterium cauense R2A-7]
MKKINTIAFIFSFIAGYVDTAGFIALSGIFTAHVTGNLVLVGASFNNSHYETNILQLILIPIFFTSVFLTSIYFKISKTETYYKLKIALLVQACLLLIMCFLQNQFSFLAIGTIGVIAMGIQNAYMKIILNKLLPTTVMTGNVTLLAIEASNRFLKQNVSNVLRIISPILGFLSGAIIGAIIVHFIGIKSFLIPSVIILLMILITKNNIWRELVLKSVGE